MNSERGSLQGLSAALFERLLRLYPSRFRREFSDEIHVVIMKRLDEAGAQDALFTAVFREITALALSIFTERWHEWGGGKEGRMAKEDQVYKEIRAAFRVRRLRSIALSGVVLAVLIALYYGSTYAYAARQIALAKNRGVYPTVEEAVIGTYNHPYKEAQVVRIGIQGCGPIDPGGRVPFVWFCTARVRYDRVVEGHDWSTALAGSYFLHIRDGWVFMPESAFPAFVGSVMARHHMEGVQ
jgi:hypothetical protein